MNELHQLLCSDLAHRLGWTLIHSLWQGAAVAGLFGLSLLIIPRSRANTRYLSGCLSLLAVVAACAITFAMIEPPERPSGAAPFTMDPAFTEPGAPSNSASPQVQQVSVLTPSEPWNERAMRIARAKLTPILPWLAGMWLLGVAGLSLWRCGGLIATYRLRRIATVPVPDPIRDRVVQLAERLRICRPVRVLQSAIIATPAVIGHLRPVILLPVAALTGLSPRELEAIIAHELAHVRRCDYLVNIVQTILETFFFHHPAVWWMSRRIRAEREHCCDDLALAVCGDRLIYARALAQVEQLGTADYGLAAAAAGGSLLRRIRRIVDASGPGAPTWSAWAPGAATIVLMLAVLFAARLRAVGADPPTPQLDSIVADEESEEIPPDKIAIRVKDRHGKSISIDKLVQWRIQLPDTGWYESNLKIASRLPDGWVLISSPGLPDTARIGHSMLLKAVSELGQPIRATGRFPEGDPARLEFTTTQSLWTTAPEKQSMEGRVTDENGRPVLGARVELLNPDMLSEPMKVRIAPGHEAWTTSDTAVAETEEDGVFAFEDLNQVSTDVMVQHSDYRTAIMRGVSPGGDAIVVKLLKPTRFQIAGRIQDPRGKPIPGAEVMLAERSHSGSPRPAPRLTRVTTADDGSFQFPGEFEPIDNKTAVSRTLFVRKAGYGVHGRVVDRTGGEAFVTIALSPAAAISGRVLDVDENPITGAEVWATSLRPASAQSMLDFHYMDMDEHAPRTRTDEQGRFSLEGVPPDCLAMLTTSAPGYAVRRTQNVETGLDDLQVALERESILKGRVIRKPDGSPVAGIRLGVQARHSGNWAETETDEQGRFEFRGLKGEAMNLLPLLDTAAAGQALEWAAAALEIEQLEPGQTLDELEMVLTKGGIVRGKVTDKDGRPLEGIDIAFYSGARPRSGAACESTRTAADGTWAHRFPPGGVYVYIRTNFPGGHWSKASYDLEIEQGDTIDNIDFQLSRAVPAPASEPARPAASRSTQPTEETAGIPSNENSAMQADRDAATRPASTDKSERVVRVIRLEHSKPADVAETIARLYPRSQAVDLADVITAKASKDGQLLLSCSPSREDEILAIIKQMDRTSPGVSSLSPAGEQVTLNSDSDRGAETRLPAQVAVETKVVMVSAKTDEHLRARYPTTQDLGNCTGGVFDVKQMTDLFSELVSRKESIVDQPRVVTFDGRSAYIMMNPEGARYEPPIGHRVKVNPKVSDDRRQVALQFSFEKRDLSEKNWLGTQFQETAMADGELTLPDRGWAVVRIPVKRNQVRLQKSEDPLNPGRQIAEIVEKPQSAAVTGRFAYLLLRPTVIYPSENDDQQAFEGPSVRDRQAGGDTRFEPD